MMDRAAKLAKSAATYLEFERNAEKSGRGSHWSRRGATRDSLAENAAELGFAPNEISAAIDQALNDAGVGP